LTDQLYKVLDFILNHATDAEIEVILSSIKKRFKDREGKGAMGLKVGDLARETARQLQDQIGFSMEGIRGQVREMMARIIHQNAPELSEEDVQSLITEWLSPAGDPSGDRQQGGGSGNLPGDVVLDMARQFIEYSTGVMPASQYASLSSSIPDWEKRYWESFPGEIKRLITLYLKGVIDLESCWEDIKTILLDQEKEEQ